MSFADIRKGNPLKKALADGGTAVGAFVRMGAPEIVELCGHVGCDFVLIDMEHSMLTWERAAALIAAAESVGTAPILRVSNSERDLITRALDVGAHGVMVAQVDDAATAEAVVAATRYGPEGTRGTAGSRRTGYGQKMSLPEFVTAANENTFVAVQIEATAGVENAAAIAAVPGLDCILVGLSDLSVDLGLGGNWDHPEVVEATAKVGSACDEHGIAFGIPAPSLEFAAAYLDRGARFVAAGDVGVFGNAMRSFVEGVRSFSV